MPMIGTPIRDEKGKVIGIACSRAPRRKLCSACKTASAALECDFPKATKASKTCDAPLCKTCAIPCRPQPRLLPEALEPAVSCECGKPQAIGNLPSALISCSRCKRPLCVWHYALAIGVGATSGQIVLAPVCFPDCLAKLGVREWRPSV